MQYVHRVFHAHVLFTENIMKDQKNGLVAFVFDQKLINKIFIFPGVIILRKKKKTKQIIN